MKSKPFFSWGPIVIAAATLMGCGGGDGAHTSVVDVPAEAEGAAPAPPALSLPPVSSRYVRREGIWRSVADPSGPNALRWSFELLRETCNRWRVTLGAPAQGFPQDLLLRVGTVVDEYYYDAQTGAARNVHTGPWNVALVRPYAQGGLLPDCETYRVVNPVRTEIWSTDGYYYMINHESGGWRMPMTRPDDLGWRVSAADYLNASRQQFPDGWCVQIPPYRIAHAMVEECFAEPDQSYIFRNLPMSLHRVVSYGFGNPPGERLESTVTYQTTIRNFFGDWALRPVDELPTLPPGTGIEDRPASGVDLPENDLPIEDGR